MTTKTVIDGLLGLNALSGQSLGTTAWKPMLFEEIVRFADVTGDHQWIHVDAERAKRESPFGAPIAHGYFTLSLIGGLFFELAEPKNFKSVLNYGLNKVRFPAPLKVNARYRLSATLGSVKEVSGGAEAIIHASIEVDDSPKPACAAEVVFRFFV